MTIRRRSFGSVLVALLLVSCAGCKWWLRITEVSGTVRLDGEPARGIRLVFEPESPKIPRAMALTDGQGVYRLGRQGPGGKQGAAAGKYRIRIMSNGESDNAVKIPAKYGTTPQFTFEVIPGEPNVFDIDLETK